VESAEAASASRRLQIAPPRAIAVNTNTLIDHTRTGSVGARIAKYAAIANSAFALLSGIPGHRQFGLRTDIAVTRPRSRQGFGAHRDSRQNRFIVLILLDK
jgi:hypothetical protein